MNRPRRIVIAAERSETLTFLQQIVQSLGHEVVAALLNGRELIEACRATSPELVITEVKIPEVDGLAALHQLNGQATFPIIIISDSVDGEVLDALINAMCIVASCSRSKRRTYRRRFR